MATPKTPAPTEAPVGLSAESIAKAGESLTRLLVAGITLPLTTANAIGTGITRLISSATTALDNAAAGQGQGGTDIGAATSNLVNATTGFYLSLIKAAVSGIDSATRAVNAAVTEIGQPPRK